jgi:hypothetical protein
MVPSSLLTPAGEGGTATQSQLDPSLQHFTNPSFDPVDFLNDSLPPLTLAASQPHASRAPGAVSLADLAARSQSLLSQLGAQNVRLSGILTQLTEEILRSGGRLAYEVEVLRGDTIGLTETLTETLHDDIAKFIPGGLGTSITNEDVIKETAHTTGNHSEAESQIVATEPQFITHLRTLNQVRARLEEVVHTFGEAMEWPLAPSELSIASSFISVSAPESGPDSHSREEKGQEVAKKLRAEITQLLDSDGGGEAGLAAATKRVDALRTLATVWKGTGEEKARNRFVDGLAKIVEDRRKTLQSQSKDGDQRRGDRAPSGRSRSSIDHSAEGRSSNDNGGPGGGLFRNLQRIRDEIYLE